MGIIKRGILGGFSGKVGNVIGGSWKGIAYMRAQPLSVANPNTAGQQAQRGAFRGAIVVARQLLGTLISTFWNPIATAMSGYNRFISENVANFYISGALDYANFKASIGVLLGVDVTAIIADESLASVTVTFADNSGIGNALATDLISVVYYNETQDYWKVGTLAAARNAGNTIILDADMAAADQLHVYCLFSRLNDNKIASVNTYTSVVVVP